MLSLAGRSALAATETWDNGGGDQLWSNNTNWNPDADVTGNDAKFTTATGTTSNTTVTSIVSANKSVNSLGYNQFGTSSAATVNHSWKSGSTPCSSTPTCTSPSRVSVSNTPS